MDVMFWIWLGIIVVGVIIEIATLMFVSIWFSFGAIIPFILSVFKQIPFVIQIIVFVVVSLTCVFILRKPTKDFIFKNSNSKIDLSSFVGSVFKLTKDAAPKKNGEITIDDSTFVAISEEPLQSGDFVEIVGVKGKKAFVKKATQLPSSQNQSLDDSAEDEFIIEKAEKTEDSEQ